MNHNKKPFINLTRLVIETISPMAIHSGGRELGFDNQLARDANGLPFIPATAIAGVWRHMVHKKWGEDEANKWFGSNAKTVQHASILQIGNGEIHNSDNKPQHGILDEQAINDDDLLRLLVQNNPHSRERVRINDLGSAKNQGKFDQVLLPKGVRFTIDIRWDNAQNIDDYTYLQQWHKILDCLHHINCAFGSSTRNGLGRFKVIAKYDETIDLQSRSQAIKKIKQFNDRETPLTYALSCGECTTSHQQLLFDVPLQANSTWRCGKSQHILKTEYNNTPKILSYSEKVINWQNHKGQISSDAKPVLCGSSIKGILAHRITFHYNRHRKYWARDEIGESLEDWSKRPKEIEQLFGYKSDDDQGQAGLLMIADAEIIYYDEQKGEQDRQKNIIHRTHNSINRFTGGVMPGALYTEELLYQPQFNIKAYVIDQNIKLSNAMKNAIKDTLQDLKTGRLSIGAGTGRGTSLTQGNGKIIFNEDLIEISTTDSQEQPNE